MTDNLLIVMPVYNEEDLILNVVNDWLAKLPNESSKLLIINDGSNDNTPNVLKTLNQKNNKLIIINKPNAGHGMAIIDGYNYAIKEQYKYIFQIDSDDQFNKNDFDKFWSERNSNYDLILGNRKNRKDPMIRIILSKIFLRAFLIIVFQKYISDPNIPFRLIKLSLLKDFIKFENDKILAPNIHLSLFSRKTKSIDVIHLSRKNQSDFSWSVKKIYFFGVNLIRELIYLRFKKIIF